MSRVKRAVARNARRKKILKLAKGYRGRSKNNLRLAIERVEKELQAMKSSTRVKNQDRSGLGRRAKNLQKTLDELDDEYSTVEHKAAIYGHMRKRLIRENKAVDRKLTQMQVSITPP